jgi:hypothetical protein
MFSMWISNLPGNCNSMIMEPLPATVHFGNTSPNMGSLLLDSSLVASGWITSQCSSNTPSLIR